MGLRWMRCHPPKPETGGEEGVGGGEDDEFSLTNDES